MHLAIGTTIASALAGLAISTAMTLGPERAGAPALVPAGFASEDALASARVELTDGAAFLQSVRYGETGQPVSFTIQVGAGSQIASRFVPTYPVTVNAQDVRFDAGQGTILVGLDEAELFAQQADASMALTSADAARAEGAPAVTDRGHVFGVVEAVQVGADEGLVLAIRLAGAGGGIVNVPQSCASIVPETGLVIVRTCNLASL